jgi:hypothetical protein
MQERSPSCSHILKERRTRCRATSSPRPGEVRGRRNLRSLRRGPRSRRVFPLGGVVGPAPGVAGVAGAAQCSPAAAGAIDRFRPVVLGFCVKSTDFFTHTRPRAGRWARFTATASTFPRSCRSSDGSFCSRSQSRRRSSHSGCDAIMADRRLPARERRACRATPVPG